MPQKGKAEVGHINNCDGVGGNPIILKRIDKSLWSEWRILLRAR
jgi:hypothetical protein